LKIEFFRFNVFGGTGIEGNLWRTPSSYRAYKLGYNWRTGIDLEFAINEEYSIHLEGVRYKSPRASYYYRRAKEQGRFFGYELLLKFSKNIGIE